MDAIANILGKILILIKNYLRVDENGFRLVETGDVITPYQEVSFTIPAGSRETVFQVFDFFRVLSLSGGTLKTIFGQNGREVFYTGAGLGYRCPTLFDRVTLINVHPTDPMTVTVAIANGHISDDRLNVSGTVTVAGAVSVSSITPPAALTTAADVAIAATTTTQVLAVNASRKEAIISNLSANSTAVRVGDASTGAARGVEIPAGGSATLSTQAAVYVYNPSASGINIGVAYTQ